LTDHATSSYRIEPIDLEDLVARGYYTRTREIRDVPITGGGSIRMLWDPISGAPMSTGHAIARFLVPELCGFEGWALFADSDILVRQDIGRLFLKLDTRYAVMCVKHQHQAGPAIKKGGQLQTFYERKNWSSVVLWNCGHPAHAALKTAVHEWPGRRLHAFEWLADDLIGELSPGWNFLVGETDFDLVAGPGPGRSGAGTPIGIAHFTLGTPDVRDYERPVDNKLGYEWKAYGRTGMMRRDGVAI
jgi:hypothetical protein